MTTGSIIVLGAMEAELVSLQRRSQEEQWNGHVHVVQTGVGKVNAAIAATQCIETLHPAAIIVAGTAAASDPALEQGDFVIATDTLQHDMDASPLGFVRGQIPFDKEWQWEADKRLCELAEVTARQLFLTPVTGRIISGDQFIADRVHAAELYTTFGARCIDMETAAIAQACARATPQVPWISVRIISDSADHNSPLTFTKFLPLAAEYLGAWVGSIIAIETLVQEVTAHTTS